MDKKVIPIVLALAVGLIIGVFAGIVVSKRLLQPPIGSIQTGQEYYATSTIHTAITGSKLIQNGYGSVAQVTITGAGTSAFTLIDTTSTESLATDARISTSTQELLTIPASLAVGTYVFDVTYVKGLYIYFDTVGTAITSTITYR